MNLSRREFLAATGGVALAAHGWGASPYEGVVLGSGSHRYQCIHNWLVPPEGLMFGDTHGLAQDSRGNIYVCHTVNGSSRRKEAVCVYREDGRYLNSWGEEFQGGAHGLDLRRERGEEFLYHCDTGRRKVVKTDLSGKVMWELNAPVESGKYGNGQPFIPTNVAFSPNGDFYVADGYGSNWIHQYSLNAEYIRTFGGPGRMPGQVLQPHGLWLDDRFRDPVLVVADRANNRLQYFDLDGKHVRFAKHGMRLPCHFSVQGDELLVPDLDRVVTILDQYDDVIVQLGDGAANNLRGAAREDMPDGKFIHPHDAIFLRNGDILVAEWVPIGRITLLKRLG